MNFLVGATSRVEGSADRGDAPKGQLEARVLAVRPVRRKGQDPPAAERREGKPGRRRDPAGGRVLLLLVPEAAKLPSDLTTEPYRVFLRFRKTSRQG